MSEASKTVLVSSIYGIKTRLPLVVLKVCDVAGEAVHEIGQFDPKEARDLARLLMEAAEAAEQDAFIVEFAMEVFAAKEEPEEKLATASRLLAEFRKWRQTYRMMEGPDED